ncbi:MAG: sulfurtransferase-like selenium metabolism protein YedF [Desulfobacterales bacterium]|jgi:selenium metabolism protein YedF|nr:sulfurtransferase-like selenium metabolism protein YedF [Deltaproteobacteria bacterium]
MKEIDARGLACPAPVLQAKDAIEAQQLNAVRVVVDNAAAQQNVQRFLESQGYEITLDANIDGYIIVGRCNAAVRAEPQVAPVTEAAQVKIMVMITTDRFGYGDDALGLKLMVNFIRTLNEMGPDLWRLVLVNNGVKLTVDGSEVLPELKQLQDTGLHILVCGTCLTHFNLLEQKQVGETTNMLDIVTAMQLADKVINV